LTRDGAPDSGVIVDFEIFDGPHVGTAGTGVTDADGVATFTYSGTTAGVDSIQARVRPQPGIATTTLSNVVSKTWIDRPPVERVLTLSTAAAASRVGEIRTLTALYTEDGLARSGVLVEFSIESGPHQGSVGTALTGATGEAHFSYTGGAAGTDSVVAVVNPQLDIPEAIVSATLACVWIEVERTLALGPAAMDKIVGEAHTLTATYLENGVPRAGVRVDFNVLSGPHDTKTGSDLTNTSGQAAFTYQGAFIGVDSIQAQVAPQLDITTPVISPLASATWEIEPVLTLSTTSTPITVGLSRQTTATYFENGAPRAGVSVEFRIESGPHAGIVRTVITDQNGQATFTYMGVEAGQDFIVAVVNPQLGIIESVLSSGVLALWEEADQPIDVLIGADRAGPMLSRAVGFENLTTGASLAIGDFQPIFDEIEALAVQPSTQRILGTDSDILVEIDRITASVTPIGSVGFPDIDALDFKPGPPGQEVLYGVTHATNELITIDPLTGQGSLVADGVLVGHRVADMSFHPDGRLFVLTDQRMLFALDPVDGAILDEWQLVDVGGDFKGLAWSAHGQTLYSTANRGQGSDLITIELQASGQGDAEFVHPTLPSGATEITALACRVVGQSIPDFGFVLTPFIHTGVVGETRELQAALTYDGTPLMGLPVNLEIVSGPHQDMTFTEFTNDAGIASFTYIGTTAGVDVVSATMELTTPLVRSNSVTSTWLGDPVNPALSLQPQSSTAPIHWIDKSTATYTTNGVPQAGVLVEFEITSGPHRGLNRMSVTNASGVATFVYEGVAVGTDAIVATVPVHANISSPISSPVVQRTWQSDVAASTPTPSFGWELEQNTPNPFNPATQVRFVAGRAGVVALEIYSPRGHLLRTLYVGKVEAGPHRFDWNGRAADGRRLPSGVYFLRLRAEGYEKSIRMIMMK
jgi:hypothetical protein